MYERTLKRMREFVRTGAFIMTLHAEEEMLADCFRIYDVERGILTGSIVDCRASARSRQRGVEVCATWRYH